MDIKNRLIELKAAIAAEGNQVDGLVTAFKALKVEVAELKEIVAKGGDVTEAFAIIDEMFDDVEAIYTPEGEVPMEPVVPVEPVE